MALKTEHTLIAIGFMSHYHVYIDVPLDEAKRRWKAEEEMDIDGEFVTVEVVRAKDEFEAYAIWET